MNNFYKQLDNAIFLALSASELGDTISLRYAEEAIERWQTKLADASTASAVSTAPTASAVSTAPTTSAVNTAPKASKGSKK